ncbi:MAG: rane protein [Burkholderiaceae bacterium]|nr:rane protein [Burkholderiaceae bacterium]
MDTVAENSKHSIIEDVQAIASATLIIALGVMVFKTAGLVTGGTTGLALLLHYMTGWRFGMLLFVVNLPFYWLAWQKIGVDFTLKTFISVGLLSVWSELLPNWLVFAKINPWFAAVLAGLLVGIGLLMLFRHQASLGGVGILAVYLQKSRGWRAGYVQLSVDAVIVLCAFLVAAPAQVGISIIGAVVLNILLAINHKPGRYIAT